MSDRPNVDDVRLLEVASTIASGEAVNWATMPADLDPESTAVLRELQLLEGLARVGEPMPDTWGPFIITGELGRGSYGTVYRAIDPGLDVEIALKVVRVTSMGDGVDPYHALREARLLAQVNHPEVVRVYRAELFDHEVGVSMELVKGRTLHDSIRRNGPMEVADAMTAGMAVCRALDAVHAARLVHGDVKAQNVMRTEECRYVLMDFGAGHDLKRTGSGSGSGTPIYMAPEVLHGASQTPASDIYSMGVLLYFLVTGTYPSAVTDPDTVRRQAGDERTRRPLKHVRPDLPDAFTRIVDRATALHPGDRYQSAGALEQALKQALKRALSGGNNFRVTLLRAAAAAAAMLATVVIFDLVSTPRWWPFAPAASIVGAGAPPDASAVPGAAVPATFSVEAGFYRDENGADVRLVQDAAVGPGDRLSMQISASVPLYVFVVNEDDKGESFLLFPLPGQTLTNPLPPDERHRLPGPVGADAVYWSVTSAGGREHFLIFASPDPPPPPLARYLSSLAAPTADPAVAPEPQTGDGAVTLRGVGGLVRRPDIGAEWWTADGRAAALGSGREDVSGLWVRSLTLQNPGR